MTEADFLLIEQATQSQPDPGILAAFRERYASDPAFRLEAALHIAALKALDQQKAIEMGQVFETPDIQQFTAETLQRHRLRRNLQRFAWLLVGIAFLWLLWRFWFQNARPSDPPPDKSLLPAPEMQPMPPPRQAYADTPSPAPAIKPQRPGKPAENTPSSKIGQTIFAAHFKPYQYLKGDVRGNIPAQQLDFFVFYDAGKYEQAMAALSSVSADDDVAFFQANALIANEFPQKAIAILSKIRQHGNSRYSEQALWFEALAWLQAGQPKQALPLLRQIQSAPSGSFRQEEASEILRQLGDGQKKR